jgi:hypothetical protein
MMIRLTCDGNIRYTYHKEIDTCKQSIEGRNKTFQTVESKVRWSNIPGQ